MTDDRVIGLVAATAAGHAAAALLASAWGGETRVYGHGHGREGERSGAYESAAYALRQHGHEPGSGYEYESVGDALRAAFGECSAVVSFLAVGATVRVLAPLLQHKAADPAVVCVDEARQFAVAVVGGHHGANDLAYRVAQVLDCVPVVTTASDAAGVTALDSFGVELGFKLADSAPLAAVGARILSGEPVTVRGAELWPLPALPPNVTAVGDEIAADIVISDVISDRLMPTDVGSDAPVLVYRPPSLVVGVGASRGVSAQEVLAAVDAALAAGGLAPESVVRLASVDLKADEPGLAEAAAMRGWPVVFHPAAELASVEVPNPSAVVAAAAGTASVAEAAARYDGPGRPLADLVVEKTKSPTGPGSGRMVSRSAASVGAVSGSAGSGGATSGGTGSGATASAVSMATAAVARLRPRGRLAIVGLGPGARDLLAPRAVAELRRASVVVGLDQYVEQIRDLLRPGTEVRVSGLGAEEERAHSAVELARTGRSVALVGSGDAGIYAMASPALEYAGVGGGQGDGDGVDDVDVVCVPGITAAGAASNVLGAPLGHDHCSISLSDLHTPWDAIERRVRAAAEGDFVVSFYNPRSRQRDWQLGKALGILAAHRPAETPVGWVRNASRTDESSGLTTLAEFDPAVVDMYTVVTVGCSQSRIVGGRFVTPRGYTWAR